MKRKNLLLIIFASFLGLTGLPDRSHATFSTFDTADLLPQGTYRLGLEPQFILTKNTGANVLLRLDTGATENSNLRFLVGSGVVPFQAGAFYKHLLFPDYENQPGISVFGGLLFSTQNGVSSLSFRVHPEISKRIMTETAGEWTPYAAVPFGITSTSGQSYWPFQLALGARWFPPGLKHMTFLAEAGLEISNAFNYISVGLQVPFDSFSNLRFD